MRIPLGGRDRLLQLVLKLFSIWKPCQFVMKGEEAQIDLALLDLPRTIGESTHESEKRHGGYTAGIYKLAPKSLHQFRC